jgi:hypothetical protein
MCVAPYEMFSSMMLSYSLQSVQMSNYSSTYSSSIHNIYNDDGIDIVNSVVE